jgi:hypothetical protein
MTRLSPPQAKLPLALLLFFARRTLARRNLTARPPRFAQSDCNRLLAALHLLARAAGSEFAALHLVHRTLDLLLRFRPVLAPRLLAVFLRLDFFLAAIPSSPLVVLRRARRGRSTG